MANNEIKVTIKAENKQFLNAVNEAIAAVRKLSAAKLDIKTGTALRRISGVVEALGKLKNKSVAVTAETAQAEAGIAKVQDGLGKLTDQAVKVTVDSRQAENEIAAINKELSNLKKKQDLEVRVVGTPSGVLASFAEKLKSLDLPINTSASKEGFSKPTAGAKSFKDALVAALAVLKKVNKEVKALGNKSIKLKVEAPKANLAKASWFKNANASAAKFIQQLRQINQQLNQAVKTAARVRLASSKGNLPSTQPKTTGGQSGGGLLDGLSKITIVGYGAAEVLGKIKSLAEALIGTGMRYNQQMETSKLGIAGILMSMTEYKGAQLQMNQALQISDDLLNQMQRKAATIGLPAEDMMAAFQSVIGPGLEAKMTLQELVDFVPTATKAVKTMLGSIANEQQITQELRAMVSGDINMDAQVSRALGITKEGVDEAKKNAGGLFAYLMEKMSGFQTIATIWPDTMTGALEKFKTMYGQSAGGAFEKVFDKAKKKLNDLTDALFVVDEKTKKISFNPELLSRLQAIVDNTILFAEKIIAAGNMVIPYLGTPLDVIGSLLKMIVDNVYGITTAITTWVVIEKAVALMQFLKKEVAAVKAQYVLLKAQAVAAMAAASTGAGAATGALGKMTKALIAVKAAVRGLASATLWGAISVAAGYAVEKVIEHLEKIDQKKQQRLNGKDKAEDFGWLSSNHEGDYKSVSTGENDPYGGISYGRWQFSTKQGTAKRFVDWLVDNGFEAGKFLKYGENAGAGIPAHEVKPGTPEFKSLWLAAVDKFGDSFKEATRAFTKETYYDPVNATFARDFGLDANERSAALREVLLSTSVQHGPGGAWNIFDYAAKMAGVPNVSYLTDEQMIPYIYQARTQYFPQDRERYRAEKKEAMEFLAEHPQEKPLGRINGDDLKLKHEQADADAKAIAKAKVNLAKAKANGELQKYLAELKQEEQSLESRYKNTKSGLHPEGESDISEKDYTAEKKRLEVAKTMAEIEALQQQVTEKEALLSNAKMKESEKINQRADIEKLKADIEVKKKNLETALTALDDTAFQAQKALEDQARDVKAAHLEKDGELVAAVKLKLEKQNRSLRESLKANGMEDALKILEENEQQEIRNARFSEVQQKLEHADNELLHYQEKLLNSMVDSSVDAKDVLQDYVDKFHELIDDKLTDLREQLREALSKGDKENVGKLRAEIRGLKETLENGLSNIIADYEKELQMEIAEINANRGLTSRQKQDLIDEAQRDFYRKEAQAKKDEAEKLKSTNEDGRWDGDIAEAERIAALKEKLAELPTLLEKVHEASKQAFEDGLLDFLKRGIFECESLGDAFRNLAVTILQSIQKVYAEAMTKSIMGALFPGMGVMAGGGSKAFTTDYSSNDWLQPYINGLSKFADGGLVSGVKNYMSGGLTSGPGTSTSDSILARLCPGEFVFDAATVKRVGLNTLQRIKSGDIYNMRIPLPKFAQGGLVGEVGASSAAKGMDVFSKNIGANVSTNVNTNARINFTVVRNEADALKHTLGTRDGANVMINWMNQQGTLLDRTIALSSYHRR